MPTPHVTALFNEAYDGLLDDTSRQRFDEHLASCPACAAEFARLSASADALRAVPAARMPVPVRLPSTPPLAARVGLFDGLRERLRERPPLLGMAVSGLAIGGAAVAAVVIAVHHTGSSTPSLAQAPLTAGSYAQSSSAQADMRGGAAAPAPAAAQADFPYSVSVPVPGHAGEVLVLATQRPTYAAGEQVIIWARVQTHTTATGPMAAIPPQVPDVRVLANLEGPAASSGAPAGPASNAADSLHAALLQAPRASSGPEGTDGRPLLTATLPTSLHQGQIVSLAALLPDSQGQLQLVGVLTLTIS
jgi:anti-sigma factor RsiW